MLVTNFYHCPIRLMKLILFISLGLILIYVMSNEINNKPAQLDLYLSKRMSEIKKSCGDICQTYDNKFVKGKMVCIMYV